MHSQIITHKSSCKWYLRLFWFLIDLAIDNAFVLECTVCERAPGLLKRKNKHFHKELATELLSKHNSQFQRGRQVQNAAARLMQQHFPVNLGIDSQCVWCSREKNVSVLGMVVKIVEIFIYVQTLVLGFTTLGYNFIREGVC